MYCILLWSIAELEENTACVLVKLLPAWPWMHDWSSVAACCPARPVKRAGDACNGARSTVKEKKVPRGLTNFGGAVEWMPPPPRVLLYLPPQDGTASKSPVCVFFSSFFFLFLIHDCLAHIETTKHISPQNNQGVILVNCSPCDNVHMTLWQKKNKEGGSNSSHKKDSIFVFEFANKKVGFKLFSGKL